MVSVLHCSTNSSWISYENQHCAMATAGPQRRKVSSLFITLVSQYRARVTQLQHARNKHNATKAVQHTPTRAGPGDSTHPYKPSDVKVSRHGRESSPSESHGSGHNGVQGSPTTAFAGPPSLCPCDITLGDNKQQQQQHTEDKGPGGQKAFSYGMFPIAASGENILSGTYEEEPDEERRLVTIGNCPASVKDFKSLCPSQKDFPWLTDDIVDARIAQLVSQASDVKALPWYSFVSWWRDWTNFQDVGDHARSCLRGLRPDSKVLLPRLVGGETPETGDHFVLWVFDESSQQIRVYDSNGTRAGIQPEDLDLLSNAFRDVWDLTSWTVSYPPQWLQTDAENCGVFVCTMADLETRDLLPQTQTLDEDELWHLRRYHASSLAAYAVKHASYDRTHAFLTLHGTEGIISDEEIKSVREEIVQGAVREKSMLQWQNPSSRRSETEAHKLRGFPAALPVPQAENLMKRIKRALTEMYHRGPDFDSQSDDFVFDLMLLEITVRILQRVEGCSHFWAKQVVRSESINIFRPADAGQQSIRPAEFARSHERRSGSWELMC